MRSLLAFSAIALLGFLAAPGTAGAAAPVACQPHSEICLGKRCNISAADMVGVTTMDFDQKNIIACLKNDAGEFRWESMAGENNSPPGTLCGLAQFFTPGAGSGSGSMTNVTPCKGVAFGNTVDGATVVCPSGYNGAQMTGSHSDVTGATWVYYSCPKD